MMADLQLPVVHLRAAVKVRDVPVEGVEQLHQRAAAELLQAAPWVQAGGVVGPRLGARPALLLRTRHVPLQHFSGEWLLH